MGHRASDLHSLRADVASDMLTMQEDPRPDRRPSTGGDRISFRRRRTRVDHQRTRRAGSPIGTAPEFALAGTSLKGSLPAGGRGICRAMTAAPASPPTWLATVGSLAPTRIARYGGSRVCAAICSMTKLSALRAGGCIPRDGADNAGETMERRRFGSTMREVAVIGQGTWYIDEADRGDRDRRAAPRPRSRHDPHRHCGDLRFRRRRGDWWARRSPGGAMRSSWSPRSFPRTPRERDGRGLRALARAASRPTGWTVTSCTGAAPIRSTRRSRPSSSCSAKARSCPGA